MSNASLHSDAQSTDESTATTRSDATPRRGLRRSLVLFGRATGFWTAVGLPFLYLPLLAGLDTQTDLLAFLCLLCINVVALVVGRDHRRD